MMSVGRNRSTARKRAAGVMFEAGSARSTSAVRRASRVVLPHRFSGDVIPRSGETAAASCANVWSVQSARLVGGQLTHGVFVASLR
jgi:hypothetical protein